MPESLSAVLRSHHAMHVLQGMASHLPWHKRVCWKRRIRQKQRLSRQPLWKPPNVSACIAESWKDHYPKPEAAMLELDVGGRVVTAQTGEIGRLANGSILARDGETVVYATVCCADEPATNPSFAPFQVNYQEKFSAAGKTTKAYGKRERQKDHEVLTSRLVDRCVRPLLPRRWRNETQVLLWVLSYDGVHSPEPLAILAAGLALAISDIPITSAPSGVALGWIEGEGAVVNPTVAQQEASRLDITVGGTMNGISMIEGACELFPEEKVLEALSVGAVVVSDVCRNIQEWASRVGKPKRQDLVEIPSTLAEELDSCAGDGLKEALKNATKASRNAAFDRVKEQTFSALIGKEDDSSGGYSEDAVGLAFQSLASKILRERLVAKGVRVDGRGPTDIRPIVSRAHILPRTHGSALFTRGTTQALCVTTLGSTQAAQKISTMQEEDILSFYLQYFFPPSCVGEVGRISGFPGRREVGHGMLASNGLFPVVPLQKDFPYTVRVESTVTESDGSSSMATVCGACLSMMDAGVPLKQPVVGIAMGFISQEDGQGLVLSDIVGMEDALGDMDFKVVGTGDRITALQMDVKVQGVSVVTVREVLAQAGEGRKEILRQMAECQPPPRQKLSEYAPVILRLQIEASLKAKLIGSGGRTINGVKDTSGVDSVEVNDEGLVEICGPDSESVAKAQEMVMTITGTPKIGKIYRGCRVVDTFPFGAFVELAPGKEGLVPISELDIKRVGETTDVVNVGDLVDVEILSVNDIGKIALSRKRVMLKDRGEWVEGSESGQKVDESSKGEKQPAMRVPPVAKKKRSTSLGRKAAVQVVSKDSTATPVSTKKTSKSSGDRTRKSEISQ